jgi:quercetin dioxygenase-like cupin family protein
VSAELTRWPNDKLPARDSLERIFQDEGLSPSWWTSDPDDIYAPHSHSYHKVLYCATGAITFRVEPDGPELEVRPGDRLDIPPGTSHSALVGPEGVTCAEAPRQSGGMPQP